MSDDEVRALERAVLAGDSTQAPRLVAALTRRDGDPVVRLLKLVTKVNAKCRVPGVLANDDEAGGRCAAHTVQWAAVRRVVRRTVNRQDYVGWCFGPTHFMAQMRDATALLVVPQHELGLVTVGVGIADGKNPKVNQAWPLLGPVWQGTAEYLEKLAKYRAWALVFSEKDRVVLTLEQARELGGKTPRKAGENGKAYVRRALAEEREGL